MCVIVVCGVACTLLVCVARAPCVWWGVGCDVCTMCAGYVCCVRVPRVWCVHGRCVIVCVMRVPCCVTCGVVQVVALVVCLFIVLLFCLSCVVYVGLLFLYFWWRGVA